jgi:hypothetical protein
MRFKAFILLLRRKFCNENSIKNVAKIHAKKRANLHTDVSGKKDKTLQKVSFDMHFALIF